MRSIVPLLVRPPAAAREVYDRIAPRYDGLHARWLRRAGAQTLAALRGALAAELRPGARVLDAGCGPGHLGRWMLRLEPTVRLTLLDGAPAMLARSGRTRAARVLGDLASLPFADGAFDLVTCAWAVETTPDPERTFAELRRVLRPGGLLLCCWCTAPRDPWTRVRSLATRLVVRRSFAGRFLDPGFPRVAPVHRLRFHGGLSTFASHRRPARGGARLPAQGAPGVGR